jgi:DASS family divalent anion:Na+ symporter
VDPASSAGWHNALRSLKKRLFPKKGNWYGCVRYCSYYRVYQMSDAKVIREEQSPAVSPSRDTVWEGANIKPTLISLTVGLGLWFIPVPEGLTLQVWHLFAIFAATLTAIILKPLPMGAVAILGIAACAMTGTLTIEQAVSSYSNKIIWLVLSAFLIARGFIKTGLGSRVAYHFIERMGKSTLGLSYGLVLTEFILSPLVPSNSARGGGVFYPIVQSLCTEYQSLPHDGTRRYIGAFLMKTMFQSNVMTSAIFMTSMAANPLVVSMASQGNVELTWTTWALAALVPGIITLLVFPYLIYKLYAPQLKYTPEAPAMAREKLKEMGGLSFSEMVMMATFVLLLVLWIFGGSFGIHPASAALFGLGILLFTGVLTWTEVMAEENAWHTFIWLGALLTMATFLTDFGMMGWCSQHLQSMVDGFNWVVTLGVVITVYFFSHYFFASMTAHITSLFSTLLVVALAAGAPAMTTVMLMAAASNICASLTHYGTGSAPVYFGAGYVTVKEWWRLGFIVGVTCMLIWCTVGPLWWLIIGLE